MPRNLSTSSTRPVWSSPDLDIFERWTCWTISKFSYNLLMFHGELTSKKKRVLYLENWTRAKTFRSAFFTAFSEANHKELKTESSKDIKRYTSRIAKSGRKKNFHTCFRMIDLIWIRQSAQQTSRFYSSRNRPSKFSRCSPVARALKKQLKVALWDGKAKPTLDHVNHMWPCAWVSFPQGTKRLRGTWLCVKKQDLSGQICHWVKEMGLLPTWHWWNKYWGNQCNSKAFAAFWYVSCISH